MSDDERRDVLKALSRVSATVPELEALCRGDDLGQRPWIIMGGLEHIRRDVVEARGKMRKIAIGARDDD